MAPGRLADEEIPNPPSSAAVQTLGALSGLRSKRTQGLSSRPFHSRSCALPARLLASTAIRFLFCATRQANRWKPSHCSGDNVFPWREVWYQRYSPAGCNAVTAEEPNQRWPLTGWSLISSLPPLPGRNDAHGIRECSLYSVHGATRANLKRSNQISVLLVGCCSALPRLCNDKQQCNHTLQQSGRHCRASQSRCGLQLHDECASDRTS